MQMDGSLQGLGGLMGVAIGWMVTVCCSPGEILGITVSGNSWFLKVEGVRPDA